MKRIKEFFKNPLWIKYKIFILPGLASVVCLNLLILAIIPQYLKFISTNKTLLELKRRDDVLTAKLITLQKIDPVSYKQAVSTALLALPESQDIPGLISQIMFLISNSRLKLDSMQFSGTSIASGNLGTFQVKVEVSGTGASIKDFMAKTKRTPRVIRIDKLETTGSRTSNDIQASMSLTAFFQVIPTTIGEIEKEVAILNDKDISRISEIRNSQRFFPLSNPVEVGGQRGKDDPFN